MIKTIRSRIKKLSGKTHSILKRIQKKPVIAFIIRVAQETGEDNAGDMAAGIAYYAMLSIFPLLLGVIALLGLFLPSERVQAYIFDFANQYLPGSVQVIQENVQNVIRLRGTLGVISIIGLFWTGSGIFEALGRVINRAWDIKKQRPFLIRKIRILIMSIITGLLFLLSMAASTFSSLVPEMESPVIIILTALFSWLLGLVLLFIVISLLLKFIPNSTIYWRDVWAGALFSTVFFEIARRIFTFYLSNFARYGQVYGSLAAVIILLVWIYFSAFILIIGVEFTSEYAKLHKRHDA